ncbi:uncharacterized protein si:ch211-153b23.7 isoform X1 [Cololabis saira]|uniref:uncharacterized protein si:ch211-153b23.7 isoform X1 n=1 Tax=Cololabis saira TaxID=129043 RepID=UPI002AD2A01D|nr:uncharacterized protein si:ch211-153b23.7 isoform X1 [Cololabis saira]
MSSVMDGDLLSLSSSSVLSSSSAATGPQKEPSPESASDLPQTQQEYKSTEESWTGDMSPMGDRLLSNDEQITLITESLTVTSTDQEKLLLLNRNTELRRVNKELMKLNDDWDQVYRSATLGLQHRLESLELENSAIKQLNNRLLLRAEHQQVNTTKAPTPPQAQCIDLQCTLDVGRDKAHGGIPTAAVLNSRICGLNVLHFKLQSAKEYYEQALMTELKKNQELQQYIRLLENKMHQSERDCTAAKQGSFSAGIGSHGSRLTGNPPRGPDLSCSHVSGYNIPSSFPPVSPNPEAGWQGKSQSSTPLGALGSSQQEVQDLKEQLGALRCQTEMYEAEYQTEHNDHKHTLQENRRLRKKREETRQQVALLQEQLKIYEDDFRRERSDKQMLQRLLLQKSSQSKEPVLIHRCNNEQAPLGGDKSTHSGDKGKQHHPLCPKHPNRDKDLA